MKKNIRNLCIILSLFIVCLTFTLVLNFAGKNSIHDTPVRKKIFSSVMANAVSVYDVEGVMKFTAINYRPDDFAEINEAVGDEYSESAPANRGTYRFYIDTLETEEWNNADKLQNLLKPDGSYHLTMYIPPVFSACSIYVQYQNQEYTGLIDRYNISYYNNYSAPSEFDNSVTHQTATKPVFIDIPVSSNPKYSKECMVTIHYESENDNFIGITDGVLIGEESAVKKIVEKNRSMLLIGAIIGAATLLLFLFICILKHSLSFVPQLIFASGIFLALFSTYSLFGYTAVPYFTIGIRRLSTGIILLASTMYMPEKAGKIPVLLPLFIAAAVASISTFIAPLCTAVSVYAVFNALSAVLKIVCIVGVYVFTFSDVIKGKSPYLRLNGIIAGILAAITLIFNQDFTSVVLLPAFWLCLTMLVITIILGFREFISAEIHNRYLTTNLEQEVAKQTKNLQTVISERDKILLYVSHDMKKTVVRMGDSLTDLRHTLSSADEIAKVDSILQKNTILKKDFADLGKYGKQNYVAEQSEVLNLSDLIYKVTNELKPDCEANGIVITVITPDSLEVYAKKVAFESVMLNLILNAIEHSYCTHLTVTAVKRKGLCRVSIIDDGKGVSTDKNIFEPFISGDSSENNSGLGLFLAKTAVESMHGTLTYERKDNLTIFSATLPLA